MHGHGGHHGGPGGHGGRHGGYHGHHGGHPMGGGMHHHPPMGGGYHHPHNSGCCGCLFPVIGVIGILIAALAFGF